MKKKLGLAIILIIASLSLSACKANNDEKTVSKLNPDMKQFFDKYYVYYTGWDSYMRNDEQLVVAGGDQGAIISAENKGEKAIQRAIEKNDRESKAIKLFQNGNYVLETHSQNTFRTDEDILSNNKILTFKNNKYTRDAVHSNYFIDGDKIVYVGCMSERFDATLNENICSKYGLFVNDLKIDEIQKTTEDDYLSLELKVINNHTVYYTKSTYEEGGYYSYDLTTGELKKLKPEDGYGCGLKGFINEKPVTVCSLGTLNVKTQKLDTDVSIGGEKKYQIAVPPNFPLSFDNVVQVISGHIFYTQVNSNKDISGATTVSLIRDDMKVAEAQEDDSANPSDIVIIPRDGSTSGCLFDNDNSRIDFCIIGENILAKNNLLFDENEYYLNNEKIDFSQYFREYNDSKDYKKGTVWQLMFIPGEKSIVSKVIFEVIEPESKAGNNIYISDYLGNGKIGQPKLLISNIGSLIGITNK